MRRVMDMEIDSSRTLTCDQLNLFLTWFSPSFPVGSFAYSHGLETAVAKGAVTGLKDLCEWTETVLLLGTGRTDGIIFCEIHHAVTEADEDRLAHIAELSASLLSSEELGLESLAQGDAFLSACQTVWPTDFLTRMKLDAPTYCVAVAAVCAAHALPLKLSLICWYHALVAGLVSAGVRLIPLGQTQGLQALASLSSTVTQAARQVQDVPLEDVGSAAPLIEIDSIQHETQYSRLFRS